MATPYFLRGLISVAQLTFVTGIPSSTLYKYMRGEYEPSSERYNLLSVIYSQIQLTRLQASGFNFSQALSLAGREPQTVNSYIRAMNKWVKDLAEAKDVPEQAIRFNTQESDKEIDPYNPYTVIE